MSYFFRSMLLVGLLAAAGLGIAAGMGRIVGAQEPQAKIAAQKTLAITARQWSFDPPIITVDQNDAVTLNITSVDVTHGFSITEFGVSSVLTPGQTTTVNFTADRAGTFSFFCSVSCGSGHSSMRGTLVVTAAPAANVNSNTNANTNEEDEEEEEEDNEDAEDVEANENADDEDENTNANSNANTSLKDTIAPTISDVNLKDITETAATVQWKTSESATGKINYGVKSGTYTFSANSGGGTSHTAKLSGLTAGATYFYQVWSKDVAGNIATKPEQKFTTLSKSTASTNTSSQENTNAAGEPLPTQTGGTVQTETATTRAVNGDSVIETSDDSQGNTAEESAVAIPTPLSAIRVGQTELPVPELVEGQAMIATSQTASAFPQNTESLAGTSALVFPADRLVTFSGKTYPLTTVTVTVASDPITKTTTSDADGRWELAFNEALEEGNHTVAVAVLNPTSKNVEESNPVKFSIVEKSQFLNDDFTASANANLPIIIPKVLYGVLGVLAALLVIVLILIVSKWSKKSSGL